MTYVGSVLSERGAGRHCDSIRQTRFALQRSTPDSVQMLPVDFLIINSRRRPLTSISDRPTLGSITSSGDVKVVIWNGSPAGVPRAGSIRTPQTLKRPADFRERKYKVRPSGAHRGLSGQLWSAAMRVQVFAGAPLAGITPISSVSGLSIRSTTKLIQRQSGE
jgi:hypothetical protein